jgi:hypothetical protein
MRASLWSVGGVCALSAAVLACNTASANLIVNSGFEMGGAAGAPDVYGASGWTAFGNVFNEFSPNPLAAGPHSGIGSLKEFGTFPGVSGAFQSFPAAAGEAWSASGFGLNSSGDAMQADNFGLLKVSFQDAGGTELLGLESAHITISSPLDQWQQLDVNGIAPAGTDHVNIFALFVQPNFNGGSTIFDDVTAVPAPGSMGLLIASGLALGRRRRS